jgi:AAA+ superfamily predicted ATPase
MNIADSVLVNELLPSDRLAGAWAAVIVDPEIKDQLLNQALLSLEVRRTLPSTVTAAHGLLILHGPAGTGKTTLARGLAHELSSVLREGLRLIEINPHGLMSSEHGQSQQRVTDLLCEHIPLLADDGRPTLVLLDEVETVAVARSAAGLTANPVDVHRATDALLTAVDRNTEEHPHIITVATSNFTEALDEAFLSRADKAIEVPLPNARAIASILRATLLGFAEAYPPLADLAEESRELGALGRRLVGVDGRRVRKLVTEAMALRRETVLEPGRLTLSDLRSAAINVQEGLDRGGAGHAAA